MRPIYLPIAKEGNISKEQHESLEADLFPLEVNIVMALHELGQKGYKCPESWKLTDWTHSVRESLKLLGEQGGFLVYPTKCPDDGRFRGQWLFDLVWADAMPLPHVESDPPAPRFDWKATRGLKLACECEWKSDDDSILEDFYKLTFVLADLRLFIYNAWPPENNGLSRAALCKRVCPLSRGFRYLLVGFCDSDHKLRIDAWTA